MTKTKNIDMCSGPLLKNIIRFTIPFMLTALFQQLYHAADVIVVGRYAGQEALAGVGTTGSLTTLILNLFLGLSVGVSVTLSRAIGASEPDKIHKTVHTAMLISIVGGAFISVFGIVFAEPLLKLIDVPDNVLPQAKIYMQIIFLGKIPALVYNFGAAILRAKGDTKRPLYIVTVSGLINMGLNLFFVIALGMKADGVAAATVISQIFSAASIIVILCHQEDTTRLHLKQLKIYKAQLIDIVKVGIPSGLQGMVFSAANVIIQSGVNSFDSSAVIAGSSASANIGNFYYVALNSFYQAAVNFVSQNYGAKKFDRIPKIIFCCIFSMSFVWLAEALITVFAGETLISLYAPGDTEAIKMGLKRLSIIGCTYGLCGIMEIMSGALRGIGYSFASMVSSIVGVCGIRILWVLTVFKTFHSFEMLFISYPLSWIGTLILHSILFIIAFKRVKKKEKTALAVSA